MSTEIFSTFRREFRLSWITRDALMDYATRELTLMDHALRDLVILGYGQIYMPKIVARTAPHDYRRFLSDEQSQSFIDRRQRLGTSERLS